MDDGELDMIPAPRSTWLHSGMALLPSVGSTKPPGHPEVWLTHCSSWDMITLEFGWCLENKAVCMEMLMGLRDGDEKNSSQLIWAG